MELSEFIEGFADQFDDTDPSEITKDCVFQNLDEWSSLTMLGTIAFIKTDCEKSVSAAEVRFCRTVEDLYKMVESK